MKKLTWCLAAVGALVPAALGLLGNQSLAQNLPVTSPTSSATAPAPSAPAPTPSATHDAGDDLGSGGHGADDSATHDAGDDHGGSSGSHDDDDGDNSGSGSHDNGNSGRG